MMLWPAVVVHGVSDARRALAPGLSVTLLSGQNAGSYMGVGWWQALVTAARVDYPATPVAHALDCGSGTGRALAALRMGQALLVLSPESPGAAAAGAIAQGLGATVLPARPPALDLAAPGASRRLAAWLTGVDSASPLR